MLLPHSRTIPQSGPRFDDSNIQKRNNTLRVDFSGMQQGVRCSLHEVYNNLGDSLIPGLTCGIHVALTYARVEQQRPLSTIYVQYHTANSHCYRIFGDRTAIGVRLVLEAFVIVNWVRFFIFCCIHHPRRSVMLIKGTYEYTWIETHAPSTPWHDTWTGRNGCRHSHP